MNPLFIPIDPFLIWFYRITGYAFVDFLIGTFVLAFITLMIGEFCISIVFLLSRKHIDSAADDVVRYQNISVDAVSVGDKSAYKAANKLANDAFGRTFFMQIAFSAAFLWPIFFSLTWMGYRFSDVEFPFMFFDYTVGYACIFIPLYIASYIIFKRIKVRIPYFKRVGAILDSCQQKGAQMKSFADLLPQEDKGRKI